jgi:hypothetical protein
MINAQPFQDFVLTSSQIDIIETCDNSPSTVPTKRAIVKYKIITKGANDKNLEWTEPTMIKIAHKFRGVPFRYDLNGGNEGSHTRDKISSPFYDVGWTYSDDKGAYYDSTNKCIWVQGEITHPEVVDKLSRVTSDGKREINYASMGAMLNPEDTKCNICGKSPFGVCGHERGKVYNGKICNMVPVDIKKALHVALTNDPADRNASIAEAIFQDMHNDDKILLNGDNIMAKKKKVVGKNNEVEGKKVEHKMKVDDISSLKEVEKERDLIEKNNSKVQDCEVNDIDKENLPEPNDIGDESEFKITGRINKGLGEKDVVIDSSESENNSKNVSNTDYANKYKYMLISSLTGKYSKLKKLNEFEAREKLNKLPIETLELYQDAYEGVDVGNSSVKSVPRNMVLQESQVNDSPFSDQVPEFGGTIKAGPGLELNDMSPTDRKKEFGHYGSWDVCFNPQNAFKYKNK